jgi:hypothetical protein
MLDRSVEDLAREAIKSFDDPSKSRLIGASANGNYRFEVFQASSAICSQKVRSLPGIARYFERLIQLPAVREGAIRPTLESLPPSNSVGFEVLA